MVLPERAHVVPVHAQYRANLQLPVAQESPALRHDEVRRRDDPLAIALTQIVADKSECLLGDASEDGVREERYLHPRDIEREEVADQVKLIVRFALELVRKVISSS